MFFISLGSVLHADEMDVLYSRIAAKFSDCLVLTDFNRDKLGKIDRLVVNIPAFELYACKGREIVKVYPITLGRKGLPTPEGAFVIDIKTRDPYYIPLEGSPNKKIADFFPPGDYNPMGTRKMHFYGPIYIHGIPQDKRYNLRKTKNGSCVALLKEDIEELFEAVPVGAKAEIYYKVNKVTFNGREVKIETFADLYSGFRRKVEDPTVFPCKIKYSPVYYLKVLELSGKPIETWEPDRQTKDDILLILTK